MSNTVGYSIGCVTPVRFHLTQGEDVTGNAVTFTASACAPGCWNGDYRNRAYWAQLPRSATTLTGGTDYYGALAPTSRYQGGGTYRDICPTVCFCEGPEAEGETVVEYLGRYTTRWMALLIDGILYYGREDGTLIQAPLDLFPGPLSETATHIALAFDANARPVFAYEDEGTVYLRRYVAGTPTSYSWTGVSPCLFFNGVVNFDDAQTDVVCYHLTESGGGLYARFQRENFGVGNLVIEDDALDSLLTVDRGRGALAAYLVFELSGKRILAVAYPVWPIYTFDRSIASLSVRDDMDLAVAVVALPTETDSETTYLTVVDDADCYPILVTLPTESDVAVAELVVVDDAKAATTIVLEDGYSDSGTLSIAVQDDSDIYASVVSGGTYSESSTSSLTVTDDANCVTE